MQRSVFVHHPAVLEHDTGHGHPERPARVGVIVRHLQESGVFELWDRQQAVEVERPALERVHAAAYLDRIDAVAAQVPTVVDQGDTVMSAGSLRAARLAAGGVVQASQAVLDGRWRRAFVAVRPPGHHAERDRAMGFCLYNNVAVAAASLLAGDGVSRVAILDFDVHHGNGTQHLFERDPNVFYASLHQSPHYPGTGEASERGIDEGEGTTLNCPLAAGTGDRDWSTCLEDRVLPALESFGPDFLLVSAGFDAHAEDPLSSTLLSDDCYGRFGRRLSEFADQHCGGRLVAVLEGGYELDALARSVRSFLVGLVDAERTPRS